MAKKKVAKKRELARKTVKDKEGKEIKVLKKTRKRGKTGDFIPKQNVEFADNFDEYYNDLPEERTHTLADGTKVSPKEFLRQFNSEYYGNDHYKEGSIHKTELGSDYDEKVVGQNRYGKDINMRKAMAQELSSRRNDVYGALQGNKFTGDPNLLYDIFTEFGEEIFPNKQKDLNSIEDLLKHYTYREILELFAKKAEDECLNSDREYKDIIFETMYKTIIISLKIKKSRKDKF